MKNQRQLEREARDRHRRSEFNYAMNIIAIRVYERAHVREGGFPFRSFPYLNLRFGVGHA